MGNPQPGGKPQPGDGRIITYIAGEWHEGNPAMISPRDHSFWMGSTVFDGARSIAGSVPDLDRHCARLVNSAKEMGMAPFLTGPEIETICRQGISHFATDAVLYLCPVFYAESGWIAPDPAATRFLVSIFEAPLPQANGFSACRVPFRRPSPDMAPTKAKASCLYPNIARGLTFAQEKGFDTGISLDPDYHVAEFSYTNLFMVNDGIVQTPAINDTFLNGITRQRVIALLRDDGISVEERTIEFDELLRADELFSTGNYSKVIPCTRIEDRTLIRAPCISEPGNYILNSPISQAEI